MRNAFAAEMRAQAARDPRVVLLMGDIGNNMFNAYKADFPERFFNCGIAEANMAGVAAGMVMAGLRPVTYTIAAFNPGRCLEQIRLDICLQNLPVTVVGVGAGLSYAALGPTHHALEDIAWMRSLPNMTVLCPCDALETRAALAAALRREGPVYLRLGKKNEPAVHAAMPDFTIGRGIRLREGGDACILSVGTVAPLALEAARLLEAQGVACGVVSLHTVKPLDEELLAEEFSRRRAVLVMEEHGGIGGAWSAVAEWLARRGTQRARLLCCATPDAFFTEGGGQDWARQRLGLDPEPAARSILDALSDA